jgi:hypothetical protein
MELFPTDYVPELNTKNLGNSSSVLTITHMIISAKRFGSYDVWMFNSAAEFCSWTEQRLNSTQLLGLGLTETLEVPNTIIVGNSLSFPMVYQTAPVGRRFESYDCRKLDWSAETEIWAAHIFRYNSGFWKNLVMTFPETLNTKNAVNELSSPLATHMVDSGARFRSYGFLKSG